MNAKRIYPDDPKRNLCFLYFNFGDPKTPRNVDHFTVDGYLYEVKHVDYNYDDGRVMVRGYCNYWGTDVDKMKYIIP